MKQLDWSIFKSPEEEAFYDSPEYYLVMDGKLFCRQGNYGSDLKNDLHSFDLKTGEMKHYAPLFLNGLVPYKDGRMLGIYYDQNAGEMVDGRYVQMTPEVRVFDPETDTTQALRLILPGKENYELSQVCLWYDNEADRIYGMNSDGLWRLSEKEDPVLVSRMPTAGTWSRRGMGPAIFPWRDGLLIAAYSSNAYLHGTDENALPQVVALRMDGRPMDDRAIVRTLLSLPELTIDRWEGDWLEQETIATMFLSGNVPLDMLAMGSGSYDLQRMMEKGYLLDLSDDPALSAIGEDSFEALRPLMYREGRLYLLPMSVSTYQSYANKRSFEAVGRQIPATVQDLLDLVKWWAEEGHVIHEGYKLFDYGPVKTTLVYLVNQIYVDSVLGQGKPLQYDIEVFGGFMRQLEAMDLRDIEPDPDDMEAMGNGGGNGDAARFLISPQGGYYLEEDTPDSIITPMRLRISPDTPAWRKADLRVIGIPATTSHPEEARRFLAAYMKHLNERDRLLLSLSEEGPIPNPRYEERLREYEEHLALYRRQEAKEEGAKKRQLQEGIATWEKEMADFRENGRYSLSADTLRAHKAFMQTVYVDNSLTMVLNEALADKDGTPLLHMYTQGAISLEQLISQANDKIRLMTLEQQ